MKACRRPARQLRRFCRLLLGLFIVLAARELLSTRTQQSFGAFLGGRPTIARSGQQSSQGGLEPPPLAPVEAAAASPAQPLPKDSEEHEAQPAGFTSSRGLQWVLLGASVTYLVHFVSLYEQLPGLYGETGLAPLISRPWEVSNTWLLKYFPSPEMGAEVLCFLGIVASALQLLAPAALRSGGGGIATFAMLWACWHDMVEMGGRFTAYQMDVLLLDAAPLFVLAAAGIYSGAAVFGLRWLFTRLYIGSGVVKLISCDVTWRSLTALQWHFQSQPLPNPFGLLAHLSMPGPVSELSTLGALVVETAAPFLFMSPSREARRWSFAAQALLQAGIALAGNFGPFNALTVVLGLSLLEDEDLLAVPGLKAGGGPPAPQASSLLAGKAAEACSVGFTAVTAAAVLWVLHNTFTPCSAAWSPAPLVLTAIVLGPVGLAACASTWQEALLGSVFLLGSAWTFAAGLGVELPVPRALLAPFDLGASSYGPFAHMTGIGGRPTVVIEAAREASGPWCTVPFRYQIMDATRMPPLCFPHFPRLDWTLWFVPLSGRDSDLGGWFGRLLQGLLEGESKVIDLLDRPAFEKLFPDGPPQVLRLSPETYEASWPSAGSWWQHKPADVFEETAWMDLPPGSPFSHPQEFTLQDLQNLVPMVQNPQTWPGIPLVRSLADSRGEELIWALLVLVELGRRQLEAEGAVEWRQADSELGSVSDEILEEEVEVSNALKRSERLSSTVVEVEEAVDDAEDRRQWLRTSASVEIEGASAADAFAVYSYLPNHPRWSLWLMQVTLAEDEQSSEWSIKALNFTFKWTAQIIERSPPHVLSWESLSGIRNRGTATFKDLPGPEKRCLALLEVSFQAPRLIRRLFTSSRRVSGFVDGVLGRDMQRFKNVVLESLRNGEILVEPPKPPPPVVDATHTDRFGTCRVRLDPDGQALLELSGFGTGTSTELMLLDLVKGVNDQPSEKRFRCIVDMRRGAGCSPAAVPHILRFLRSVGGRFDKTAVLGPRPLMALARVISQAAKQPGVEFFTEFEVAQVWVNESLQQQ